MTYLTYFKQWLRFKKYNSNTIRNYLADTRKYLRYIETLSKSTNPQFLSSNLFSQSNLQSYLLFIKDKKNSRRYLTSLSKYFQFALSENLIEENSFKTTRKQVLKRRNTHFDKFLQMYQTNLIRLHKTPITIKNYINDIQQLFDFYYSQSVSLEQIFKPSNLQNYVTYLENTHRSLSSIKRKLSSLSSFQKFLIRRKLLSPTETSDSTIPLINTSTPKTNKYESNQNSTHQSRSNNRVTRFFSHFIRNDISKMAK